MRRAALLAVALSMSAAAPAFAQNQPEAGIPGGIGLTYDTVAHNYSLTASYDAVTEDYRLGSRDTPKRALAKLNRWCESDRRADKQRCEAAWQRINAEYARMQAARAD